MHIINTIAPVFLLIGLGLALRYKGFLNDDLAGFLNHLAYWIGLPSLLFYKVALIELDFASAGKTFVVVFGATILAIIAAYLAAFIMRIPVSSWGTLVQGAHRGNLAYIGLAIIIYSLSNTANGLQNAKSIQSTEAVAVLVVAMIVPFYNIISIAVLLISKHQFDRQMFTKVFRGIITNPLTLACICGLLYSFFFDSLPIAIDRSLNALGQMALPVALMAIGASLAGKKIVYDDLKPAVAASLIKIFVAPLIGFIIARAIGLGDGEMLVAMVMLACPTAVASYVMTHQIGGNAQLSAQIIIISTMLSAISLGLAVGFFASL